MPARDMNFTFNKDIELNKENVKQLEALITENLDEEQMNRLKDAFSSEKFDKNFFKFFIKELKSFSNVSIDEHGAYCSEKTKAILPLIQDIICNEPSDPQTILGLKYLYDEWDYEGCGSEDHYYLSFADESKEIKKFTKEAEKAIEKLVSIGVKASLVIQK